MRYHVLQSAGMCRMHRSQPTCTAHWSRGTQQPCPTFSRPPSAITISGRTSTRATACTAQTARQHTHCPCLFGVQRIYADGVNFNFTTPCTVVDMTPESNTTLNNQQHRYVCHILIGTCTMHVQRLCPSTRGGLGMPCIVCMARCQDISTSSCATIGSTASTCPTNTHMLCKLRECLIKLPRQTQTPEKHLALKTTCSTLCAPHDVVNMPGVLKAFCMKKQYCMHRACTARTAQ